ncbi:Fc.00g069230.m01.CDS01 [Cosmosporella sp. VM-42]
MSPYQKMADSGMGFAQGLRRRHFSMRLLFSYAFDWVSLIVVAGIAAVLGHIEPNKRPFSLVDPDISFPFTEHETVPPWLLLVLNAAVPIVIVTVVSLIFVPGPTVPKDTPKALIWKRKLWELHVGLLGLALALVAAWFFTESMKNMFGKPRPDLLSRCDPDIKNAAKYVIGGFIGETMNGQLYSAKICQQKDSAKLNDGFRSYPSGHSSSAAAGLIYTSLFLASKFAVTIPFVVPAAAPAGPATHAAFPSRMRAEVDPYEPTRTREAMDNRSIASSPYNSKTAARQNAQNMALRRQAAAPPIYLLVIVLMPFCLAVFIASSRWFDFRHHGFDILFGFLMGVATSIYSFRYYHLPIQEGAGWAWGPRSEDRAFWAGVGVLGYAGDKASLQRTATDLGESSDTAYHPSVTSGPLTQRPVAHIDEEAREPRQFQSVELTRMDSRDRVEERGNVI